MHTLYETYVITGGYTDEDDDGSYDDSASNTVFKLHINYSILVNGKGCGVITVNMFQEPILYKRCSQHCDNLSDIRRHVAER
jgi:hypothetical protein